MERRRRRRRGGRIRCPKGRVPTEREREREKRELSVLVTYSFLCVPRHKQRRWKREGWGGWRGAVFAWPPSRVITRTSGVVGVQLSTLSAIRSCLTTDIAWSMAPSIARLGQNCLPPLHPLPPCTYTRSSFQLSTLVRRRRRRRIAAAPSRHPGKTDKVIDVPGPSTSSIKNHGIIEKRSAEMYRRAPFHALSKERERERERERCSNIYGGLACFEDPRINRGIEFSSML